MRLESNRAPIRPPSVAPGGAGLPLRSPTSLGRWRLSRAAMAAVCLLAGCGDSGAADAPPELGEASQPIIGGSLDEVTNGVVGLALDVGGRVAGHCSGTLIAPNLVLTARHCVALTGDTSPEGIVECDTAEFERSFPARMLLTSADPVRPRSPDDPSYVRGREVRTLGDAKVCGSDIALIILERPLPPAVVPIAPRLLEAPSARERFSTVGYGLTSVDDPSSDGTRQRADGSAVRCSGEECVALSDGSIRSSEWASVDAPICSGDSGGPALDALGRVFGVASRGDPSCQIAVFGDVSNWAPFIVDTALSAADVGDYAPPDWALEARAPAEGEADCGLVDVRSQPPGRLLPLATMVVCATWMLRRRTGGIERAARRR